MKDSKGRELTHVTLREVFVISNASVSKRNQLTFSCDTTHAELGHYSRDDNKKVIFTPTHEFPLPSKLSVYRDFTGQEEGRGSVTEWQKYAQDLLKTGKPCDLMGYVLTPTKKRNVWRFLLGCMS